MKLDIVNVTSIAARYAKGNSVITVMPNRIKTIRADFVVSVENDGNQSNILFISKVLKDDILRYNSQFTKEFASKYYVSSEIMVTEAFGNQLRKVILINNRKSRKVK